MFGRDPRLVRCRRRVSWKPRYALLLLTIPPITIPSCEPNSAHLTITSPPGNPGQATLNNGQCVTLKLEVRFKGSETYIDETANIPSTAFHAIPAGRLMQTAPNIFCATPGPPTTGTIY